MEQGNEPGPFLIDLIFATSLHKCISLVVSPPASIRCTYCSGMRNLIPYSLNEDRWDVMQCLYKVDK